MLRQAREGLHFAQCSAAVANVRHKRRVRASQAACLGIHPMARTHCLLAAEDAR
jgi:hypothetical protein